MTCRPKSERVPPAVTSAAYLRNNGNVRATAKELGISRPTVGKHIGMTGAVKNKPLAAGALDVRETYTEELPEKGGVFRYILTAAQNNTKAHTGFLKNLEAFAHYTGAVILVSRFTYNKNAYSQNDPKPDTKQVGDLDSVWYDPRLVEYFDDTSRKLAPGLVWCGEMNIMPTAVRPLSGFETYTGRNSGIFPHAKIAMESIVAMKGEGTKFNYTTGAVTQRNYIQKKAGLKADFHHSYGALLVEVDSDGNWFCRHLNATNDGAFYDLDIKVQRGRVSKGHRLEAINWGDFHAAQTDPDVLRLGWGKGSMLDALRPRYQFMHDLFDMHSRSHHNAKNCHRLYERFVKGEDSVEQEVQKTALALDIVGRKWCKTIVVDSNHDSHLERWLREADYRFDPVNAAYFLRAQQWKYDSIRMPKVRFHLLERALRDAGCPRQVQFLHEDESFIIARSHGGGVECGMHGHLGPNGSRGSIRSLSRLGRKANIGHSHSAGIFDGVYQAGTSSILRLEYNVGPSSWSHSHIVTYANGKRAIVTIYKGKWRA